MRFSKFMALGLAVNEAMKNAEPHTSVFRTAGLELKLTITSRERVLEPDGMKKIMRWLDTRDATAPEIVRLGAWVAGEEKGEGE